MKRHSWLLLLGMLVVELGVARADPVGPTSVAEALFEEARQEMQAGDYEAAYSKLLESERIDPANGTLLNLLLCEERMGKVASAWLHARELWERLPVYDDRRPIVERRLRALSVRLPKLTVRLAPTAAPGTELTLDGTVLGPSSQGIPLPIDPGRHRLVAAAEGRASRTYELSVMEAKEYEWQGEPEAAEIPDSSVPETVPPSAVPLGASRASGPVGKGSVGAPPPDVPARGGTPAERSGSPRWIGWTSGTIGAAALIAGAVMGALALHERAVVEENCPEKVCRDQTGVDAARAGKKLVVGTVAGLAVGAVGLGFGIYVLTEPDAPSRPVSTRASPSMPSAVVVTYAAAF